MNSTNTPTIVPVILAGGSGSRLWPMSRALYPKQFLPLYSPQSMLQDTLSRLEGVENLGAPLVICNENHRFIVAEHMRELGISDGEILLEPIGRNTAPAIAAAAIHAMSKGSDPILLVLAADHVITNLPAFHSAIKVARDAAEQGRLVTFGIPPTHPETGYGYIQAASGTQEAVRPVSRFVEKPDLATAKHYLDSGEYLWNSGMFVFRASAFIAELERLAPEVMQPIRTAVANAAPDMDFIRLEKQAFSTVPDISVDYAVIEKTAIASVVSLDAGWSDVGSWSALSDVNDKDSDGNASRGDTMLIDSSRCYVHAEHRLVAAIGLQDVVVVETADAVLISHKDQVQQVKTVVDQLKAQGRNEATIHRHAYRPWGVYDSIDSGMRYQVKRITVKPGAKLSVQMHHHRAEHWIVVSGTAKVRIDGRETLLTENQSTYIPVGSIHSLENPGKIPLELVEVQSGAYLGEDDIVRFEDRYGRT